MKRRPPPKSPCLSILIVFAFIGLGRQALASGDFGCSTQWRLVHHNYEGCSNMALLSPSNDTRVNLLLLLADVRPASGARSTGDPKDSPLFQWDAFVDRFGSQADKEALKQDYAASPADPRSCPASLPPNDPFTVALQADRELKPEERDALLSARTKTQSGCPAGAATDAITSAEKATKSSSAKAYALYLEGAAAFWQAEYDKAAATFSSLATAQPAWVRETATYMVGRSLINRAQAGAFDEYGSFKKDWHADPKIIAAVDNALDTYLQRYPAGAYAQSARGLKRRGYWLAGDTARLANEYGALLMLSPQQRGISDIDLLQEIDNKITSPPDQGAAQGDNAAAKLLQSTRNPFMLAMLDLQAMRTPELTNDGSDRVAPPEGLLSLAVLQQQKTYFASQLPLYEYLLAVHAFYIEKNSAAVLRIIPDAARQGSLSYVQFSRQLLRGMALEAGKDSNALGFWLQMLLGAQTPFERPVLELAIASHQERAGRISDVFAPASPVHYPYLREVLLANIANADLLRTQTTNTAAPQHERDVALFTLLYKEATRGDANSFLKDLPLVPSNAPTAGSFTLFGAESFITEAQPSPVPLGIFLQDKKPSSFNCPGLRATEQQLSQDASNPTAQLCVADFVRLNESVNYFLASNVPAPTADELGGTQSLFPGGSFVRMDTYKAVLANAKSSRNDRAYALFRAINCYASSGNNGCGGDDVPKAQRKAWFTTLKRDYTDTRWANELKYYW